MLNLLNLIKMFKLIIVLGYKEDGRTRTERCTSVHWVKLQKILEDLRMAKCPHMGPILAHPWTMFPEAASPLQQDSLRRYGMFDLHCN